VKETLDSTIVSSVGPYVNRLENMICRLTGASHAIATVNGTSALHIALMLAGVKLNDEVITQALTFVATPNSISYCGARPIFLDVEKSTLGMSPYALEEFLKNQTYFDNDSSCYNKKTKARIAACVPMHTFGFPARIDQIVKICQNYNIPVVEDSAESLGSTFKSKYTGTFGILGIFSFNGNKTITSGGGGVIITDNEILAKRAKHLTTTSKVGHQWDYFHDEMGYNYRLPNLNAALACAQLEQLEEFIIKKRDLAESYNIFFNQTEINFLIEPPNSFTNYWLMAILLNNETQRNYFLKKTNELGIHTRPAWRLMNELPMYKNCYSDSLINSKWLTSRLVNLPSSVIV